MKNRYETPESIVQQLQLESIASCSGGPIILPEDEFDNN